jgi:hypothetical protein
MWMDYLSRRLEYESLLHEADISGEEHLKIILENPSQYLKKVNEVRERVSSDSFLPAEDKEMMLKKINGNLEKFGKIKGGDFWNYALAFLGGAGFGYMLPHPNEDKNEFGEDFLKGFKNELERMRSVL